MNIAVKRLNNRRVLALVAFLLTAAAAFCQTNDEFRTFVSFEGRARVADYNAEDETFLLERENGKTLWAEALSFRLADRRYLKGWLRSYEVLSGEALKVSVLPQVNWLTNDVPEVLEANGKLRECGYRVSLKKRSGDPVEDVHVEYRYFIAEAVPSNCLVDVVYTNMNVVVMTNVMADVTNYVPVATNIEVIATNRLITVTNLLNPRQLAGEFTVGGMTKGDSLTFDAGSVQLAGQYESQWVVDLFGSSYKDVPLREERIEGVWLKLHGTGEGGIPIVRDICIPWDLRKTAVWSNTPPTLVAAEFATQSSVSTTTSRVKRSSADDEPW